MKAYLCLILAHGFHDHHHRRRSRGSSALQTNRLTVTHCASPGRGFTLSRSPDFWTNALSFSHLYTSGYYKPNVLSCKSAYPGNSHMKCAAESSSSHLSHSESWEKPMVLRYFLKITMFSQETRNGANCGFL